MTEFSDDAYVAYPSSWPEDMPSAHCTLLYLGPIAELNYDLIDFSLVMNEIIWPSSINVQTGELTWFGEDNDIPVVPLHSQSLQDRWTALTQALDARGYVYDTKFGAYKPHITIEKRHLTRQVITFLDTNYVNRQYIHETVRDQPVNVELYKPEIWWGDDHYKLADFA